MTSPEERSDNQIAADVQAMLDSSIWVDGRGIEVKVEAGTVTLEGNVDSAVALGHAADLAWVAGVHDVEFLGLDIVPDTSDAIDAQDGARKTFEDGNIARMVQASLDYRPCLENSDIDVSVRDGVVTLSGSVDHLAAQTAARESAQDIRGVVRVKDQLKVRPTAAAPDWLIVDRAAWALARDPFLADERIVVVVDDGQATLEGEVGNSYARRRAASLLERVAGITAVQNRLEVFGFSVEQTDDRLEHRTRDMLERHVLVDAESVEIEVDGGIATLRGGVEDMAAYRTAELLAFAAGAAAVENRLAVTVGPPNVEP